MGRILLVDDPQYHKSSVKPLNYEDWVAMYETKGLAGFWRLAQTDAKTGEVVKELWSPQVITDNGAVNVLASAIANASNANPWNNILITNNDASTTLAASTGTSAITTVNVNALPAALPANTNLVVNYGGTTQVIAGPTGSTAQGTSGALTVPSWTPASNYAIGTNVVPQPSVTDNPSNANLTANATTALSKYSGVIASGGFVYSATTGAGNRSVVVTFVFKNATNGGSTTNGAYTSAWLVNVTSGAANTTTGLFVGNYVDHVINMPLQCNDNNNITAAITVKL